MYNYLLIDVSVFLFHIFIHFSYDMSDFRFMNLICLLVLPVKYKAACIIWRLFSLLNMSKNDFEVLIFSDVLKIILIVLVLSTFEKYL